MTYLFAILNPQIPATPPKAMRKFKTHMPHASSLEEALERNECSGHYLEDFKGNFGEYKGSLKDSEDVFGDSTGIDPFPPSFPDSQKSRSRVHRRSVSPTSDALTSAELGVLRLKPWTPIIGP